MRRGIIGAVAALVIAAPAFASSGVEHLHFATGPYLVSPAQT